MKEPSRAVTYSFVYPILASLAREKGYSLALHGSMQRDLDLIAIPWVEEACSAVELMEHMAQQIGIFKYCDGIKEYAHDLRDAITEPTKKPHGRVSWAIQLRNGFYIDLSVMPRQF